MVRNSGRKVLPALLATAAVAGTVKLFLAKQQPDAFLMSQQFRGSAAAALAAAALAGAVAAPLPAEAVKFSFFGFGDGTSDPYASLDKDADSPYSQFPNSANGDYNNNQDKSLYRGKKKVQLVESFKRLEERLPRFIKAKDVTNTKSTMTLQCYMMKDNMEYLSGDRESPAFKMARSVADEINALGVDNRDKKFDSAMVRYTELMAKIGKWKDMVEFDKMPETILDVQKTSPWYSRGKDGVGSVPAQPLGMQYGQQA